MDKMVKFLKEKITDNSSLLEIIDVFEQMCKIPLEEDMILFETGTFTSFSDVPIFQISLVGNFQMKMRNFIKFMWIFFMIVMTKIKYLVSRYGMKI